MWGAIAAAGKQIIGKEKEEWAQQAAQAGSMAQGMMGKSEGMMQQQMSMDYSQIPSYKDFTNFK
ncbi:hypothetical protein [Vibrio sp. 10N.222.55.C7]|uniref:hypothetical protein n=1 Tax=Vibrio sp. 10N.222.55.C7 TaxID=3229650 RepID=UPI00354EB324